MEIDNQTKKLFYETTSRSFPESSLSQDQIERARWRWKFLRLSEDYRKKCQALKVKTFLITPQYNEFGTTWINPDLSFDEIIQAVRDDLKGADVDDRDKAVRLFVLYRFGMLSQPAVSVIQRHANKQIKKESGSIEILVNLNAPDSQILHEVAEILKERRAAVDKKRRFKKLAEYHRAFTLYQAGKTYEEIESIMAQDETLPDVREINVSRLIRKARKLIKGGYRDI
jgi:hypothetical protein